MRRRPGRVSWVRGELHAASGAFAAILVSLLLGGSPASAAGVFIELNPSTVPAGDPVGLRASCVDNLTPAKVRANPIGTVDVTPQFGFLTATVTVPAATKPGDYTVTLACSGKDAATATLHVVARVVPSKGPATGFGGTAGAATGAYALVIGGLLAVAAGLVIAVRAVRRPGLR